ncbi:hypothetical protein D9M68_904950 [compost metagenome]
MPDGVFRERLDRQRRNPDVGQRLGQLPGQAQAIAQPELFDLQIAPREGQLFGKEDRVPCRERGPEQVRKIQ